MDEKSLHTLEYFKILERLAGYAAFSASADLARDLRPTTDLTEAHERLGRTSEARYLLSMDADISVGGASDIRPLVDLARRSGVLTPSELLMVSNTLLAARSAARTLSHQADTCPHLAYLATPLVSPPGIVESISSAISERGEVMDSASDKLRSIRSELRVSHDRLMTKLQRMLTDSKTAPMLQEGIITTRNGRYVIPLRAEYKGQLRAIIHDQSSSGATLFVEPLAVVDLNNRYHEMQLAERDEERRILAELSSQVGLHHEALFALVVALAEIDLTLACARYSEDLHASEPLLSPYREHPLAGTPGSIIRLRRARHPLLDPATVVPIDVELDEQTFAVVITGPNTGGKTVTLKTVGLMVLMAQSGLHIPAQSGSELSLFDDVFADIGDEQSIEQSLSTFSGHITNIVRVLAQANDHTLVLFDELGAGTDPQEGSALARAILTHLLERRIPCLVATHYAELKAFAHSTAGVINASMEFNLDTLRPTYHLIVGLPGRSNALAIAERLGLPAEIIASGRSMLTSADLRTEDLLDEIHRQRDLSRVARAATESEQAEAERLRTELERRLEAIEDERQRILQQAHQQAEAEVAALQAELDEVRRALLRARQPLEALKPVQEKVEALEETTHTPVERRKATARSQASGPFRVGERVYLRTLKTQGVISAISTEDAEVQVGNLRLRTQLKDLQRASEVDEPVTPPASSARRKTSTPAPDAGRNPAPLFRASPGLELDIRGQRAEDALDALDRYLENAFLAGLPYVRIIHGKGTGKLRQVVRDALHESPHVSSFEAGQEKEGGDGVTVAHLLKD